MRPLIHAHYLFFGGQVGDSVVPDLAHGLVVQRVLHEIADKLGGRRILPLHAPALGGPHHQG
jgi:hypothetical protein